MLGTLRKELEVVSSEIIIIDGGSRDGTVEWLKEQEDVITIQEYDTIDRSRRRNRHTWGHFMNLGFRRASASYVCMLSDDCLVVPGAIINGCNLIEEQLRKGKKVGAVAFYWRNWPEQRKYWVGLTLGNRMFVNHGLYMREALEDVKFADEERYQFYFADGDICLKMWEKGYICIDSPDSYIEHCSHANRRQRRANLTYEKKDWAGYLNRWNGIFYDEQMKNKGGWIEKEYHDPLATASLFEQAGVRITPGLADSGRRLVKKLLRLWA